MEVLLSVGNTKFPTNLSSYLPLTLDCNSIFSVTLYIVGSFKFALSEGSIKAWKLWSQNAKVSSP